MILPGLADVLARAWLPAAVPANCDDERCRGLHMRVSTRAKPTILDTKQV